jgi:uncharacterized membrane protein
MIRRGITGHCYLYGAMGTGTAPGGERSPEFPGFRVDRAVTVNRPRSEVYRFWRSLENLPRFMQHIESVRTDGVRSHWVATLPGGRTVHWEAVINNEVPDERIAWRTLPGSDVLHAGSVVFTDAPGGRGTEVHVEMQYRPPAGPLGLALAKLWGEKPARRIHEDLHRFKQIMEAGEVPRVEGQPTGRELKAELARQMSKSREAEHASEMSFPASDAPALTPVKGGAQ